MPETYISFPELRDYGIQWSRVHLGTLMGAGIFPPDYSLSANRRAWRKTDVERFLASRLPGGEPVPRLWPRRERLAKAPPAPGAKPIGRPRGSRVVRGADGKRRLVRPEDLPAREAADAA